MQLRSSKPRVVRWALGFGLLVSLILIVNGILAWQANRRWQQAVDEIRRDGEPVSILQLAPIAVRPDQNAALILNDLLPVSQDFNLQNAAFEETPLGKALTQGVDAGELPTAEQLAALRKVVDAYPALLAGIDKASQLTEYASQLDFGLPPEQFIDAVLEQARSIRNLARFVYAKATILIATDQRDEAIRLALRMIRISRIYGREPMLFHSLVGVSVRSVMFDVINQALRHGGVDPTVRVALDAELANQGESSVGKRLLINERAFCVQMLSEQVLKDWSPLRWSVVNANTQILADYRRAIADAGRPWPEIREYWNVQQDGVAVKSNIAGSDEPAPFGEIVRAVFVSDAHQRTLARCLRVFNSLQQFRAENGREASGLDELRLPTEAIIDPFSSEPIRLKLTDKGWIVYSVWDNGVDDRGRINYTDGDWGITPLGYPKMQ